MESHIQMSGTTSTGGAHSNSHGQCVSLVKHIDTTRFDLVHRTFRSRKGLASLPEPHRKHIRIPQLQAQLHWLACELAHIAAGPQCHSALDFIADLLDAIFQRKGRQRLALRMLKVHLHDTGEDGRFLPEGRGARSVPRLQHAHEVEFLQHAGHDDE